MNSVFMTGAATGKKCLNFVYFQRLMMSSLQQEERQTFHKTALYDFHRKCDGRMIPFAGYLLPVQYGTHGIAASHMHTRNHVSIFDVSHMLQTRIHGQDRETFVETFCTADVKGLNEGQGCLTIMTNDSGGIIDDLIVSKTAEEYLYIVSNAGCRTKDLAHIQNKLNDFKKNGGDATLEIINDHSLIAVQGPGAVKVLQSLVSDDLSKVGFMKTFQTKVDDIPCRVTRCGYTGEDGFEISVPDDSVVDLVEMLMLSKLDDVRLAGLGARDSLRLEAGLCLYGNDMDESVTPVEASLMWLIGKRRKQAADFPGADAILKRAKQKPAKKRIGLISQGPPARGGTKIFDGSSKQIGEVTSGFPSPVLKKNISMGYVDLNYSKVDAKVLFEIRNKMFEAIVTKMPFVPHRYHIEN